MSRTLRRPLIALALILGTVLAGMGAAAAHNRSESYVALEIGGEWTHLTLTVPVVELERVPMSAGADPLAALIAYLDGRFRLRAGGAECAAAGPPRPLAATSAFVRLEWRFHCGGESALHLHSEAFFDVAPAHLTFIKVRRADGAFAEYLLDGVNRDATLGGGTPGGADKGAPSGFGDFIALGIEHIMSGLDHMAFLLGLMLVARRPGDLLLAITGFTLGHSLTLALAVFGLVRPDARLIDPLIGFTIALVAAEAAAVAARRAGPVAAILGVAIAGLGVVKLAGGGGLPLTLLAGTGLFGVGYLPLATRIDRPQRLHLALTGVFGLVHGFGFANALMELKLAPERLAGALVGFNLGVEIGQVGLVILALAVTAAARRLIGDVQHATWSGVGAAALAGVGLFWFAARGFT